ncbi:MAG: hypothetical protein ABIO44_13140 [Saprospiraceae bacterium]
MKKFYYLLLTSLVLIGINSCGTDPVDVPPTIVFVPGGSFITADASGISGGSTITTRIKATKGSSDLNILRILWRRNGQTEDSTVDATNLKINGLTANSNPLLILASSDLAGFTYTVSFPASSAADTITYYFQVEDKNKEKATVSFKIYTDENRISILLDKKLYNKDGPAGFGGIDLQTGNSTGSTDLSAELKDEGNGPLEWMMQFSARNPVETTIRLVLAGTNFTDLNSKTDIVDAYDNGNMTTTASPSIGSTYIVKSGIFYFAINIKDLYVQMGTGTGKNGDYFLMDIKQ